MTPDPTGHPLDPIREIADDMEAERRARADRRCGTCRWWENENAPQLSVNAPSRGKGVWGYCMWAKAHLPASIDIADTMEDIDGTDCATWDGGPGDDE